LLFSRIQLESHERAILAPYASFSDLATREFSESRDEFRTAFQRDHARIIHSKAFRRLRGKTQVFVAHYGDHFRNRLTHTLEVAQISRNLARNLGINEDLTEIIALAHDLGHTPFGHAGEERLNELLQKFDASFEHNRQSRRILTTLEKKYSEFNGLNPTRELLDGLAKHQTIFDNVAEKFVQQPSLEAQIVNLADEIAYTNHDIDDGLRAKIFSREDLQNLKLWSDSTTNIDSHLSEEAWNHRAVSALIATLTTDLLFTTEKKIQKNRINSLKEVQNFIYPLAEFSTEIQEDLAVVRDFLREKFYFVPVVKKFSARGVEKIEWIFNAVIKQPKLLPVEFLVRAQKDPLHIVIADFIAGMTDDFAENFYDKIKRN